MPRLGSKQELLDVIEVERQKLDKQLENLTDEQMELPGACESWSVKDILSHLADREKHGQRWYRAGLQGELPKTPDEAFNWRQLPALNHQIYLQYKDLSLEMMRRNFLDTYAETKKLIDRMAEEELLTPRFYEWTGNSLLRDYVNANTAAHYR